MPPVRTSGTEAAATSSITRPFAGQSKKRRNYNHRLATVAQSKAYEDLSAMLRESAVDYVRWALATQDRRRRVNSNFVDFHVHSLQWKKYAGNEFDISDLLGESPPLTICAYIRIYSHRVT